ncbi:hypothetical protein [Hyphococcus luteus]|jgi:NAD(P)-dependent dehydrogenase (short-subunit alcohol dehydrogenase family)|uniref:Uncharacterized protein n=1 Tax=Hyphococcus luteus TaxID=2058213 RepID=A0A2S7K3P0_9PROT|nr:hypothetical protein [Marinicaulis flavus]PQA87107.1 hypothetical protein CW354_13765 [Marinicaulis flavus]
MKTVDGKTAFITGGAGGVGLGIAKALAGFAGGARSNSVCAIELDVANREADALLAAPSESEIQV